MRAAGARFVLDDHGLPDVLRQLLPDEPREEVIAAAGGKPDDQAKRPIWKIHRGIALRRWRVGDDRSEHHQCGLRHARL